MSFLATILVAFAIGFTGHSTTAPEQPVTAPVTAQQVQQVQQVDPVLLADAMATLEDYDSPLTWQDDKGRDYTATYVESDGSSDSKYGEFTLESIDFPGTFHHYVYDQLHHS